ncbi:MAG: proline iminopeptidase-family hydrolase [Candidatus Planktophila sp.]
MTTGAMKWEHGETAYEIFGDLTPAKTPLILAHGGPGFTSHSMKVIARYVAATGRPAITYDQIGCGGSTHLQDKPKEFWSIELFKKEFGLLVDHLGISGGFALLGHSWGGLLAAEIAITRPGGLKALVLSSALGDTDTWEIEARRLALEMPAEFSEPLIRHEDAGTVDSPEYAVAIAEFYRRHLCRIPAPAEILTAIEESGKDQTVYSAMWGHSELSCTGNLKHHVVTDRLSAIEVPTQIFSGRFDESTAATNESYLNGISGSTWELFEESAHMTYVEEAAKYQRLLNAFLEKELA